MSEPQPVILMIEDEAQMRRFLRAPLSHAGYQLLEAETAEQG
jgi:two-component system KDP operon response regulator KdpE